MSAHPRQQIISPIAIILNKNLFLPLWLLFNSGFSLTAPNTQSMEILSFSFSFFSQPSPQTILRWWQWKPQELKLWEKRTLLSVLVICGSKEGQPCWFFSLCVLLLCPRCGCSYGSWQSTVTSPSFLTRGLRKRVQRIWKIWIRL